MQENRSIRRLTEASIGNICPEYADNEFLDIHREIISEIETLFSQLDRVYDKRHKYSLSWAFENAQVKFNKLFMEILRERIDTRIRKKNLGLTSFQEKRLREEINELIQSDKVRIKKAKHKSQRFSILSTLVSLVDIVISIILIVIISQVSHFGESILGSPLLGLMLLVFVAFLKVTLDRFYIIPRVDRWGWELYKNALCNFKNSLAILLAISLAVDEMIKNQRPPSEIIAVIDRGSEDLKHANSRLHRLRSRHKP